MCAQQDVFCVTVNSKGSPSLTQTALKRATCIRHLQEDSDMVSIKLPTSVSSLNPDLANSHSWIRYTMRNYCSLPSGKKSDEFSLQFFKSPNRRAAEYNPVEDNAAKAGVKVKEQVKIVSLIFFHQRKGLWKVLTHQTRKVQRILISKQKQLVVCLDSVLFFLIRQHLDLNLCSDKQSF